MYDIGYIDKQGNVIHSIVDKEFNGDFIDLMYQIQEEMNCEVFSIQRVFIEKEK